MPFIGGGQYVDDDDDDRHANRVVAVAVAVVAILISVDEIRTDREEEKKMSPPSHIVLKNLLFHSYSHYLALLFCGRFDKVFSVVA